MAKVKITGHASGTGILTVTAPNTSSDRTITLPDATGELLSVAGGTMTGNIVGGATATLGFFEHTHTISSNLTITTDYNALSAGPITVASGYSVTVPSGSTWVIV